MRVGKNRLTMHIVIRMSFVLFIAGAHHGYAQRTSGFIPFHRLGLSYQRAFGVDVGLIVYNTRYGYQRKSFYDLSAGVESLFAHHVAFVPKVNVDFGVPLTLSKGSTLGGGVDLGWYTDFRGGEWRVTLKIGTTLGSVFRCYYGYHHYFSDNLPLRTTRHRISFELNIAAIHDFHTR